MLGTRRTVAGTGSAFLMVVASIALQIPEAAAQGSQSSQSMDKFLTILRGAAEALGNLPQQGGQANNPQPQVYPQSSGGYPPPQSGNSPQAGGYPQSSGAYPAQSSGYPQPSSAYPAPQSGGYPQPSPSGSYPAPQAGGYPQPTTSSPPQGAGGLQDAAAGFEAFRQILEQFKRSGGAR